MPADLEITSLKLFCCGLRDSDIHHCSNNDENFVRLFATSHYICIVLLDVLFTLSQITMHLLRRFSALIIQSTNNTTSLITNHEP